MKGADERMRIFELDDDGFLLAAECHGRINAFKGKIKANERNER